MLRSKEKFKEIFVDRIETIYGISLEESSDLEQYTALSSMIKDYIHRNWVQTHKRYNDAKAKQVYYLSIEFLPGKQLGTNLLNLGLTDICKEALSDLNISLEELESIENDPGIGNGGLGRLGSCFLESMASSNLPGHGCTIRYEHGLFRQKIIGEDQVEVIDDWIENGNVWEVRKPNRAVEVKFGGNVKMDNVDGRTVFIHENYDTVLAVPHDMPVIGYNNNTVNTLRLFSAEVKEEVDYTLLSGDETRKSLEYEVAVKKISESLYPNDESHEGKVLRLKQQYFLVSAGLQTIIKRYRRKGGAIRNFYKDIAIHINDTHPSLAIPELMRIFLDEYKLGWDEAWGIVTKTISYTNHTIMPEALEKWSIDMFKGLLPRIYMIVEEINRRFNLELERKYGQDENKKREMSILYHGQVHMANLAIIGSHSVNGVAKVHTEILKNQVMKNFYEFYPEKFNNKTNGITHRTWLLKANPSLSKLITSAIGDTWITKPSHLTDLLRFKEDNSFKEQVMKSKKENKELLQKIIEDKHGISIDTNSIIDVQVKRIHEYKRQLLNVLHILDLYYRLKDNPKLDIYPRTFIFGGKAAPGYFMAKRVINLINSVGKIVNNDKSLNDKIKVIYLEGYRASLAERIFPATDVSEQISTASKEASGTGNMKFMLNGALTIGTLDGANIEIRNAVGDENFFKFGLTVQEVLKYYADGGYNSREIYDRNFRIKRILNSLVDGSIFGTKDRFRCIYDSLLYHNDQYFVLKDFEEYVRTQNKVEQKFKDKNSWAESCIVNIANAGIFSSDRTIKEYAEEIWNIEEVLK
ncbi:glycogen/starch/alpha-glucan phosphorylase GlgP [Gottschalkia acidurici 9a]|uniref:Alpha-1,4 glucan phosphorylase n=1 Tax=Gottschalkia acidurici (strain ATCC 7906 / DSM 604 / BCRC 14475 / CIP 104303 / KCTC 5404 / NCIMB 10678 / 9a) TaxID=1128398 RepID=K0AWR2_GOTA9|nr:glycogen/starch/alpha-glucan phosphorylase [Gottschalkia acidurici]AFS77674.1 glycogen/starch/alpha-glucan phosphorylase GlgP [Gottschalkia acidurici 9a]